MSFNLQCQINLYDQQKFLLSVCIVILSCLLPMCSLTYNYHTIIIRLDVIVCSLNVVCWETLSICDICTKSQLFRLLFSTVPLLLTVVLNCFVMIFMVVTSSSATLIPTLLFVVLRRLEVWILISRPKVYCMGTSANLYPYVCVLSMIVFLYSVSFCPISTLLSSSSSLLLPIALPPSSSLSLFLLSSLL